MFDVSHFQTREERRGWCPPLSDGRQRVQHLSNYRQLVKVIISQLTLTANTISVGYRKYLNLTLRGSIVVLLQARDAGLGQRLPPLPAEEDRGDVQRCGLLPVHGHVVPWSVEL